MSFNSMWWWWVPMGLRVNLLISLLVCGQYANITLSSRHEALRLWWYRPTTDYEITNSLLSLSSPSLNLPTLIRNICSCIYLLIEYFQPGHHHGNWSFGALLVVKTTSTVIFTHFGQCLVIEWHEYHNLKKYISYIGIHKTMHLFQL